MGLGALMPAAAGSFRALPILRPFYDELYEESWQVFDRLWVNLYATWPKTSAPGKARNIS